MLTFAVPVREAQLRPTVRKVVPPCAVWKRHNPMAVRIDLLQLPACLARLLHYLVARHPPEIDTCTCSSCMYMEVFPCNSRGYRPQDGPCQVRLLKKLTQQDLIGAQAAHTTGLQGIWMRQLREKQ